MSELASSERVIYVANARIPSRKAHPYQIIQACHGFAQSGADVELVVPTRRQPNDLDKSVETYYDTPIDFSITRLPCIDLLWIVPKLPDVLARVIFYLQSLTFSIAALIYTSQQKTPNTMVFSRALVFTTLGSLLFEKSLVVELHRVPSREWVAALLGQAFNRLGGVVTISEGLAQDWKQYTNTPILVAPDGVRLDRFAVDTSPEQLRSKLGLSRDVGLATYIGSIKPWKGVDTLVRAAERLPTGIHVCLVGGSEDQRAWLREEVTIPDTVHLVDHVPPDHVPGYLAASDVLVLPNSAKQEISARHTSPLKLFEYMAAGRPIVASDLPSIREVLNEELAFFFEPDDPASLATHITDALEPEGDRRARRARDAVEQYTWERRAVRIRRYASS